MDSKKVGIIFVVIGITAISSFLLYPLLNEKTENAVPVLKSFSDSGTAAEEKAETSSEKVTEVSLSVGGITSETASAVSFPIDVNAASAEELTQIKGIGRTLAENIVAYREAHGYFRSAEDLLNVDGIGGKKLDNIRDMIFIDNELFPETAAAPQSVIPQAEASSVPAVTTVPQSRLETSRTEKTTAGTTVTPDVTTENPDDGQIIEEITDFTDFRQTEEQSLTTDGKANGFSFSELETSADDYKPNFPLELNTASARDLACINGIGDTLAERIVEYARSFGFYDVNDLLNVSGIGQSKLNSILPYVYADASGLPPKEETTASSYFDPWDDMETASAFPAETTASAAAEIYRVNVNTATKADFMQLPGIDETLADNIIYLRSQIGYFLNIEELSLADGMTNSRLSAIWNYIYV